MLSTTVLLYFVAVRSRLWAEDLCRWNSRRKTTQTVCKLVVWYVIEWCLYIPHQRSHHNCDPFLISLWIIEAVWISHCPAIPLKHLLHMALFNIVAWDNTDRTLQLWGGPFWIALLWDDLFKILQFQTASLSIAVDPFWTPYIWDDPK